TCRRGAGRRSRGPSAGWPRTRAARAAARRCRTAAASRCAAVAGRPRTAPTGSGTRARTAPAPGPAWRRAGSCLGFFGRAQRIQCGLAVGGIDAVAKEQIAAGGLETVAPERGEPLASIARRLEARAQQQHALALDQLEVEAAIGLAVLLECRHGRALARRRRGIAGRADRAEVAQADRVAQLRQERRGVALAQPARTLAQLLFDAPRVRNERLVALAQRRDLGFDALEQLLLGVAPGDALGVGLAHARGFLGAREGLEDLEQRRAL